MEKELKEIIIENFCYGLKKKGISFEVNERNEIVIFGPNKKIIKIEKIEDLIARIVKKAKILTSVR